MADHFENVLRKTAPLVAAAVGVWGAGILADDLPDSVRASALQELRVLDRTPAVHTRRTLPPRSTAPAATTTVSSPANQSKPAVDRSVIEPTSAASTEQSSPTPLESSLRGLTSPHRSEAKETSPTIQPARPTIVRPPIRSRSANPNPWNELSTPSESNSNTEPDSTQESTGNTRVPEAVVPTHASETATSKESPFAEVLSDSPAKKEVTNPFDADSDVKDWRPAATTTKKIASPPPTQPTPHATVKLPPKQDSPQRNELSAAATRSTDSSNRSKRKSEQIGADRPVSVLDFLAQNAGEPAGSSKAIANAKVRPSAEASSASDAFARSDATEASADSTPAVEQHQSAVVANGLPRSVGTADASQHPLESVDESDARLATPPGEQVARDDAPQSEQQKLEARAGRDGFMGFCPVTLRDQKTLVDGKSEFSSSHGGQRFDFANAEAKSAFDADPERYTPAHGGRDIVLAAGQIDVPGSLRHATYYKSRLYLFRSAQTCQLFEADPVRYVADDENDR